MSWFILFIAGLLEVVWAVGLKYTHGFSRLVPSVITIVAMVLSMALLSWAMKTLPVGTAYAVWTGNWRSRRRRSPGSSCWASPPAPCVLPAWRVSLSVLSG